MVLTLFIALHMCRRWEAITLQDPSVDTFDEWVRDDAAHADLDTSNPYDMDRLMLSTKPSQRAARYIRMKVFGNHFRVEDDSSCRLQTYDSGVAFVFQVPSADATDVSVNYVGVLKDILKLNYGPIRTPIILFRCEWMKRRDNRDNPTYIKDDAGFLVVNFRHKLPKTSDPFIFPSQATQVFFSDEVKKPRWKVVLRKEARSRREVIETPDLFITTTVESSILVAPEVLPCPPQTVSLVGAIELSAEENLLARATY
jgi:hypothetical protein